MQVYTIVILPDCWFWSVKEAGWWYSLLCDLRWKGASELDSTWGIYIYTSTAALQSCTSVLSYPHVYINNHLRIWNHCVLSGPCTNVACMQMLAQCLLIIFNVWNCGNKTLPHTGTITWLYDASTYHYCLHEYTYVQHTGVWTAGRLHRMPNVLANFHMITGNLTHCLSISTTYHAFTVHLSMN